MGNINYFGEGRMEEESEVTLERGLQGRNSGQYQCNNDEMLSDMAYSIINSLVSTMLLKRVLTEEEAELVLKKLKPLTVNSNSYGSDLDKFKTEKFLNIKGDQFLKK